MENRAWKANGEGMEKGGCHKDYFNGSNSCKRVLGGIKE